MTEIVAANHSDFVKMFDSMDFSYPLKAKITSKRWSRTLSQNALFHLWCGVAATELKLVKRGDIEPAQQMKLVWKHMFLGYESFQFGKSIEIKQQLRHTSKLPPGDMHHFMTQVQSWASDKGIALTSTGEFQELMEAQNA